MTFKASSGLRDHMLSGGSVKSALDGGLLNMYGGAVPATADADLGGATLLSVMSSDGAGAGINMDTTAAGGILPKAPAEAWHGTNVATDTATFYRHVAAADDGTLSTSQPRIQGTIGLAGADLNMTSIDLVSGAPQTLDFYTIALPTL